jgi:hypothetical protein
VKKAAGKLISFDLGDDADDSGEDDKQLVSRARIIDCWSEERSSRDFSTLCKLWQESSLRRDHRGSSIRSRTTSLLPRLKKAVEIPLLPARPVHSHQCE